MHITYGAYLRLQVAGIQILLNGSQIRQPDAHYVRIKAKLRASATTGGNDDAPEFSMTSGSKDLNCAGHVNVYICPVTKLEIRTIVVSFNSVTWGRTCAQLGLVVFFRY